MSVKESHLRHTASEDMPTLKKPLWQRLGWLAIIWTGSVLVLFVFATLLKMFMTAAGMKTH